MSSKKKANSISHTLVYLVGTTLGRSTILLGASLGLFASVLFLIILYTFSDTTPQETHIWGFILGGIVFGILIDFVISAANLSKTTKR